MTNRERVMNILHYKPVDRMPAVHFGYWGQVVREWADQGKIPRRIADEFRSHSAVERELDALIGWDCRWSERVEPKLGLFPPFERKVLETLPDGTQRVQSPEGMIQRIRPGISSIPSEDDYLLKDREAFETLYRPKMQFSEERVCRDYFVNRYEKELYDAVDEPIGLYVGSIMGDIRNMVSVVGMSYLLYDEDEDLFADMVDTYADMQYQCVEEVLKTGVKFDYAHFWEDICFKSGPLLSPEVVDELCAKHYKKRTDLLHKYGIDVISLDCDGVVEKLLPTWFNNGVNTMFPIEIGVWGDQFADARAKYGKGMLGVGGMDKTAFRKDKAAVDAELERLRRLAALGGFVPCPDHHIMPGSSFELVQYYAEEVKKIKI